MAEFEESTNRDTSSLSFSEFNLLLRQALRRNSSDLQAHLVEIERKVIVGDTKTLLHIYSVTIDAHSRPRVQPLAEFLRDQIVDYAIPRKTINEAFAEQASSRSSASISRLHEKAKRLFTHLSQSGEGGELLLFAMAESVFGLTQLISKMSLKTSTSMHYHGSDGVYAEARQDGGLNLFWGESKVYADVNSAIRNCLESLAPFLNEIEGEDAEREQDIFLLNEFINFDDERIIKIIQNYLDRNNPASLKLRHCGFALVAFDCAAYHSENVNLTADLLSESVRREISNWVRTTNTRIASEGLIGFDIHLICLPIPSAEEFRRTFLQLMGVKHESE